MHGTQKQGTVLGILAHQDGDACGLLDRDGRKDERGVWGLDHRTTAHIAERSKGQVEADSDLGGGCAGRCQVAGADHGLHSTEWEEPAEGREGVHHHDSLAVLARVGGLSEARELERRPARH